MTEPDRRPIDADVDLHVSADRRESRPNSWPVLTAISVGGVLGALARYGLQATFPQPVAGFAWATFGVNVSGCLLIGAVMVLVTEVWTDSRLLRPFLGVGVLGGFTTFSTYVIDVERAVAAGAPRTALAYLAATLVGALVAVWLGAGLTGQLVRRVRTAQPGQPARGPGTGRTSVAGR